jgi:hypothetical protein
MASRAVYRKMAAKFGDTGAKGYLYGDKKTFLTDKETNLSVLSKNQDVSVVHRYGGLLPGMSGTITKVYKDARGNNMVKLFLGKNLSGQRLIHSIPFDSIKPK